MIQWSNISCYLFLIFFVLCGIPENFRDIKIVQQPFQLRYIAHVTLNFYQEPLYPLRRNQQECCEVGVLFIFLIDDLVYNVVYVYFY